MNAAHQKFIAGAQEWCSLPQLDIAAVQARVDSGAKTSSIHAFNIEPFTRNSSPWVRFDIHPIRQNRRVTIRCESPTIDRRIVKSSNGQSEKRFVIRTPLTLNGQTWDIELTLANRDTMGFRMLLGREAMSGRLLVDSEEKYLFGEVDDKQVEILYGKSAPAPGSGLKIGLLATDPDLYSNRRLIEAGEKLGHEMVFLNIRQCYMKLDADSPAVHYRDGRILNDLDAVIPRIRPAITFYGCAITRHFESLGVFALNNATAITQSRDKLYSLQLLQQQGLDIPITGYANSPNDTDNLIEMVGGAPLIVKLLEGSQGRGVVLAETTKAAESVINAMKSLRANLLVQEYIEEAGGKDLRCFMIDGKVAAAIQREAAPGEFRANLHRGGHAHLTDISPEEEQLAIKATQALKLNVAGVDIIRSTRGPLLLEVNSSPGLEGIEAATGQDVAAKMIQAIEKQISNAYSQTTREQTETI
ncbi:alpha-L-glutamate ligase [Chromatiales bacterium (ex Bugula neritina AB1)]|nr:alpha-L-glutamate ligase [Chromatiales bacterium (ex Bugula neritina AB1)]